MVLLKSKSVFFFIDHIWVFKHLYAKHNPVSGELELHTTPWSSFECLFHDDKRAVEFREKFETNKSVKETLLAAHLEEKCSGEILFGCLPIHSLCRSLPFKNS